jgi:hypothetical protein
MIRIFSLFRNPKPTSIIQLEAQTLAGNAAALAKHGAEQRRRDAKARQDETTAKLRMEIAAGYCASIRNRSHNG